MVQGQREESASASHESAFRRPKEALQNILCLHIQLVLLSLLLFLYVQLPLKNML